MTENRSENSHCCSETGNSQKLLSLRFASDPCCDTLNSVRKRLEKISRSIPQRSFPPVGSHLVSCLIHSCRQGSIIQMIAQTSTGEGGKWLAVTYREAGTRWESASGLSGNSSKTVGLSEKQLRTARNRLKVMTRKSDFKGGWIWELSVSNSSGSSDSDTPPEAA